MNEKGGSSNGHACGSGDRVKSGIYTVGGIPAMLGKYRHQLAWAQDATTTSFEKKGPSSGSSTARLQVRNKLAY